MQKVIGLPQRQHKRPLVVFFLLQSATMVSYSMMYSIHVDKHSHLTFSLIQLLSLDPLPGNLHFFLSCFHCEVYTAHIPFLTTDLLYIIIIYNTSMVVIIDVKVKLSNCILFLYFYWHHYHFKKKMLFVLCQKKKNSAVYTCIFGAFYGITQNKCSH